MSTEIVSLDAAVPFAASGLVSIPSGAGPNAIVRLRPYAILPDGRVFLLVAEQSGGELAYSRLDPVPATVQPGIREAHPAMELRFPRATTRRPPVEGDDEIVEVDPTRLNLVYGGSNDIPQPELLRAGGQVFDGDWDTPLARSFVEIDNYRALRSRIVDGAEWQSTDLYRRVVGEIANGRIKWGCRTEEEFKERCASLDRLTEEIRVHGYKTQAELGTKKPEDEIRIAIGRDGRPIFVDGRHRLSIARILGLPSVPVRIVARHAQWQRFKDGLIEIAERRGGRIYQQIDHPDLADIPAQHTDDRLSALVEALRDYPGEDRRMLDLGTHWGHMCQQMGKLGFKCTGIERNPTNRRIAEMLSIATESGHEIWGGDLLDFPDPGSYELVFALNIFHHLIKTEELHERLVRFLGTLRAERIMFEPHRHDPPGQMERAYRNYPADEFAAFVAEHAGLSTVARIGQAADGRQMFMLS